MKVSSLYLDTSVIGGYFDAEWTADTRELWAQARAGKWRLLTSIVAEREVQKAPEEVRQHFASSFDAATILDTSDEIEQLAEAYLVANVVPRKFTDDALHVAMATCAWHPPDRELELQASCQCAARGWFQCGESVGRLAANPYRQPQGNHLCRTRRILKQSPALTPWPKAASGRKRWR